MNFDNYFYSKQNFSFYLLLHGLLFRFVINLGGNNISDEGTIALAEALKLNLNLARLDLCIFLLLFIQIITIILSV